MRHCARTCISTPQLFSQSGAFHEGPSACDPGNRTEAAVLVSVVQSSIWIMSLRDRGAVSVSPCVDWLFLHVYQKSVPGSCPASNTSEDFNRGVGMLVGLAFRAATRSWGLNSISAPQLHLQMLRIRPLSDLRISEYQLDSPRLSQILRSSLWSLHYENSHV